MADGLNYLIEEEEKEDISTILESGDYNPNDWEKKFLEDMSVLSNVNAWTRFLKNLTLCDRG